MLLWYPIFLPALQLGDGFKGMPRLRENDSVRRVPSEAARFPPFCGRAQTQPSRHPLRGGRVPRAFSPLCGRSPVMRNGSFFLDAGTILPSHMFFAQLFTAEPLLFALPKYSSIKRIDHCQRDASFFGPEFLRSGIADPTYSPE